MSLPAIPEAVLIGLAGALAGVMNALAGGGSFVSLPALIAVGLPSVSANATSTVALLPGSAASAWVYRRELSSVGPASLTALTAATLAGAVVGSVLLLTTPSSRFDRLLPWLLLIATIALASGPAISRWLTRRRIVVRAGPLVAAQFALGIYSGYFGGAVGIMMMATWSLLAEPDFPRFQSARLMLVSAANALAVAVFAVGGIIRWPEALALAVGATIGGYGGAHVARRLPTRALRAATVLLCAVVTVLFFLRARGPI